MATCLLRAANSKQTTLSMSFLIGQGCAAPHLVLNPVAATDWTKWTEPHLWLNSVCGKASQRAGHLHWATLKPSLGAGAYEELLHQHITGIALHTSAPVLCLSRQLSMRQFTHPSLLLSNRKSEYSCRDLQPMPFVNLAGLDEVHVLSLVNV